MTTKANLFVRHPWVRIAASLIILGALLSFLPLHKVGAALRIIPVSLWLGVVTAFVATHLVGAAKWRFTLRLSNARLTFAQAARCYLAGVFGTIFLPSVVGGDIVRMGLAFRIERNRAGVLLGSVVDRLLDIVALGAVAAAGVLFLPGALNERHRRAFMALAIFFTIVFAAFLIALRFMPWRQLPFKLRRLAVKLRRAARCMGARPQYVLVPLALSIIIQIALLTLGVSLAKACGIHLDFRVWLLVWPLAKLLALAPVTLGGLGVREAGMVAMLAPFGVSPALALAAGLAWESIILAGGLCSGLISFVIGGSKFARTVLHFDRLRSSQELTDAA
ncbi:MAG: lysylphosphatidylglycerol synthase transmembrane domain-containing protein [Candidatus Korobacteraceae bacterium]